MVKDVEIMSPEEVSADGNVVSEIIKTLDANSYATKKTIAQGLLDVALLTANASQLKYILQVGEQHEFYSLMLGLIITSIILQIAVGILCLCLLLMRDCRLHMEEYHRSANILNYFTTACAFVITVLNLVISCFDPTIARYAVFTPPELMVAILFVVIGGLNLNRISDHHAAMILNDVILIFIFIISIVNIIISGFGIEYSNNPLKLINHRDDAFSANVIQVGVCIFLGSSLNINKNSDHDVANVSNNIVLFLNVLIVIVNVFISGFDMKENYSVDATTTTQATYAFSKDLLNSS